MSNVERIQNLRRGSTAQPHRDHTRYYRPDADGEAKAIMDDEACEFCDSVLCNGFCEDERERD